MKKIVSIFVLAFALLVFSSTMYGQATSETNFSGVVGSGARAFGMGGAFIAIADDATAASWNPGGLGQLERPEFSFVFRNQVYNYIFPAKSTHSEFTGPQDFSGTSASFDFASFTYPFRIGSFKLVPQISYQRGVSFDVDNVASDVRFRSEYYEPSLRTPVRFEGLFKYESLFSGGFDTVTLSLGSKLFKGVNAGFSVNFWMNGYEGKEYTSMIGNVSIVGYDISQMVNIEYTHEKSFDISGVNFNAGLLVELFEGVKIGVVYRSGFDADITYSNTAIGQSIGANFNPVTIEQRQFSGSTTLEWPMTWGVGLSVLPEDKLTFSVDYTRTYWSDAIIRNYNNAATDEKQLDVYFPTLTPTNAPVYAKQLDTEQLRFGLEYIYMADKIIIPFRLGLFTDSQFYRDAAGEEIKFIGITGGVGIKWGPISIDVALMYETGKYMESNVAYSASMFDEFRIYVSTIFSL